MLIRLHHQKNVAKQYLSFKKHLRTARQNERMQEDLDMLHFTNGLAKMQQKKKQVVLRLEYPTAFLPKAFSLK